VKTVLLDCDDVLLNWLEGFKAHCSSTLERYICPRGPQEWVLDDWLGTDPQHTARLIKDFNSSRAFGDLPPVEGAEPAIASLYEGGARLHVVTSCSSDWFTVQMRKANLQKHFGDVFDSVICLDLGQSKEQILRAFNPPCIWVEDNLKNALIGVRAGHKTFMRQTSHNSRQRSDASANGITWFTHWGELNLKEHL